MASFNSFLAGIRFRCIFSFTCQNALCQGAELYLLYYVNQNYIVMNRDWCFSETSWQHDEIYGKNFGLDFQGFTEIFGPPF